MRACRWVVAVATTSCRNSACASPCASAFVHYAPRARRASPSSAASSTTSTTAFSSYHSGSSIRAFPNRPGVSPCPAMLMSTSPGVEGGGGGGESWCGHELLNTVTTEWLKDHLHDPEVCPKPNLLCACVQFGETVMFCILKRRYGYVPADQPTRPEARILVAVDCRLLFF